MTTGTYAKLEASVVNEEPEKMFQDDFFEEDPDVLASFAFAYDEIINFRTKFYLAQLLFPPACMLSSLVCYPCFLSQNVRWASEAQHVALTQDGIKYVVDQHPTLCGFSCTDQGRKSKTVPYDKLTDCDIEEPAGNACCCCVKNVLATVNVDTASSGGAGTPESPTFHELTLVGLKDPHAFKRAVWAMKRGEPHGQISVPESLFMRNRGGATNTTTSSNASSDLAKRAEAFDTFTSRDTIGDLTKVDFLLADKDYATLLLDASKLKEQGLMTDDEYDEFKHRLKLKVKQTSS